MTQQKALRELRERLSLSRAKFAQMFDLSAQSIERYEAELPEDLAAKFAEVADRKGFADLAEIFLGLGNESLTPVAVATPPQAPGPELDRHAQKLIAALLKMLDDPQGDKLRKVVEAALEPWLNESGNATEVIHKRRA